MHGRFDSLYIKLQQVDTQPVTHLSYQALGQVDHGDFRVMNRKQSRRFGPAQIPSTVPR